MTPVPPNEQDHPDTDGETKAEAMKDQLRGDVTSWMAARSEATSRQADEMRVPVVKPPTQKAAARSKQAKTAPAETKSAEIKKKPFGMSYDGMSQADYITYMISRGAR